MTLSARDKERYDGTIEQVLKHRKNIVTKLDELTEFFEAGEYLHNLLTEHFKKETKSEIDPANLRGLLVSQGFDADKFLAVLAQLEAPIVITGRSVTLTPEYLKAHPDEAKQIGQQLKNGLKASEGHVKMNMSVSGVGAPAEFHHIFAYLDEKVLRKLLPEEAQELYDGYLKTDMEGIYKALGMDNVRRFTADGDS